MFAFILIKTQRLSHLGNVQKYKNQSESVYYTSVNLVFLNKIINSLLLFKSAILKWTEVTAV